MFVPRIVIDQHIKSKKRLFNEDRFRNRIVCYSERSSISLALCSRVYSKYFLFFVLSFKHSLYFYHPLSGGRKISENPHFIVILGLRISTFESEPKWIVNGKYETLKTEFERDLYIFFRI